MNAMKNVRVWATNNMYTILWMVFIVLGVAWFTAVFDDGLLWIAIFGAGVYLGKRCE